MLLLPAELLENRAIQSVELMKTSDSFWEITPPSLSDLISVLYSEQAVTLSFSFAFSRYAATVG